MSRAFAWTAGLMATILSAGAFANDCVPITNNGFDVNGIVAYSNTPSGVCLPDTGWGGTIANAFTYVEGGGLDDTHVSRLAFAGEDDGGANLERLYVGLHAENDDAFNANDVATLYFDAQNLGTFGDGDFALRIELGPNAPPQGLEECGREPNAVSFYRFQDGTWVDQDVGSVDDLEALGIKIRSAYDYNNDQPDTESRIWEVEIGINLAELDITVPKAVGLRMGAKLYLAEPDGPRLVLDYPKNLTSIADATLTEPFYGNVTPAKLTKLDVESCSLDVRLIEARATDHLGNVGRVTKYPNIINGGVPEDMQSQFTAELQLVNPQKPNDTSVLTQPDHGFVDFFLKPFGTTPAGSLGFLDTVLLPRQSVADLRKVGQKTSVHFRWPADELEYSKLRDYFSSERTDHVCVEVHLDNFDVNVIDSFDVLFRNLQFTTASTITDQIRLRPFIDGSPRVYYLRARWNNLSSDMIGDKSAGLWDYSFLNGDQVGMKEVGDGWYRVEITQEGIDLDLELNGGAMNTKVYGLHVNPNAGGAINGESEPPTEFDVQPGQTITTVAKGTVNINWDYVDTGPDGFARGEGEQGDPMLLSYDSAYNPMANLGALIGSFDDFQTSFVIGGTRSFVVPEGASRLSLAVNDFIGRFDDNYSTNGKGYEVSLTVHDPVSLPTSLGVPGNPLNGLPAVVQPGAFLPQFLVDVIEVDEKTFVGKPIGYFAYAVYDSHVVH